MSEWLSKAKEQFLVNFIAVFWFILFTGASWGISWMTATAGVDYSTLDHDAQVRIWVCCFVAWATTMMAWLNNTLKKLTGISLDDPTKQPPASPASPQTKV